MSKFILDEEHYGDLQEEFLAQMSKHLGAEDLSMFSYTGNIKVIVEIVEN